MISATWWQPPHLLAGEWKLGTVWQPFAQVTPALAPGSRREYETLQHRGLLPGDMKVSNHHEVGIPGLTNLGCCPCRRPWKEAVSLASWQVEFIGFSPSSLPPAGFPTEAQEACMQGGWLPGLPAQSPLWGSVF